MQRESLRLSFRVFKPRPHARAIGSQLPDQTTHRVNKKQQQACRRVDGENADREQDQLGESRLNSMGSSDKSGARRRVPAR